MYTSVLVAMIFDIFVIEISAYITNFQRFILGLIFFLPAIIQLSWKPRSKFIKILMRSALGFSIWLILSFVLLTNSLILQIGGIIGFISGIYLYSTQLSSSRLSICNSCKYDQSYHSCLIRYYDILSIDNIDLLATEDEEIREILALKSRAKYSDAIILPTKEIR